MAPSSVHLPNGQTLTVTPIFGGLSFRPNDLTPQRCAFPPGWTVSLNEEDDATEDDENGQDAAANALAEQWDFDHPYALRKQHVHRYKKPTLHNDHLFISSISNPNSNEFKAPISPTRQIAMMLWATLWWYFHQPEPSLHISTKASIRTPDAGKPKAEWKININKEGIFKGKQILAKLERMGLIACGDSSVGGAFHERTDKMFVSRRAFWQLDARIYLFTLAPVLNSPMPGGTPFSSRPSSPARGGGRDSPAGDPHERHGSVTPLQFGPFQSTSHLPTYYPPHPAQYTFTNNIRHPIRPRPYRQGETFYCRYVPSVAQYLSFRVASLSPKAVSRQGPWIAGQSTLHHSTSSIHAPRQSISDSIVPTMNSLELHESDLELLHRWMNDPRVAKSWGEDGPQSHQEQFLQHALSSNHSFPAIGCWDGKPFGYFEVYWVKEDVLGKHLGGDVGDFDKGLHALVGENEFRGPHRVHIWLSALVHYCWLSDMRTDVVMMEPRIDNAKLLQYCQDVGFFKEKEVTFPHKQSNLMKIRRDAWEKPMT